MSADVWHCRTGFENAHGTVFRELLYPWHPWCGLQVAVHEAITRADGVAFRCTLSGSDRDRGLEIPAWMFERGACPDQARLAAQPSVNLTALAALADLLRQTSPSALPPVASKSSHDQDRGEIHDSANGRQRERTPSCAQGRRGPTQQIDLFGGERTGALVGTPAWRDLPATTQAVLTSLMARLILEHAEVRRDGPRTEAGHDL